MFVIQEYICADGWFRKNDLFIQILKTILLISLSILLVHDYQLHAIVLIFFISNLGVNLSNLYSFIKNLILTHFRELFS